MTKRIIAICFIYLSTAVAWAILGTTVFVRTNNSDSTLRSQVASLWGAPQEQSPAQGWYSVPDSETVTTTEDGKQVTRARAVRRNLQLPIDKSRVQAALHLDYRRKGLLWYSTYTVNFAGAYDFRNDSGQPQDVTFSLNFPTGQAIYDDVTFTVNGAPLAIGNANMEAYGSYRMSPGEVATVRVAYRSQGLESWTYNFGDKVNQVKDFELRVATDFTGFDFPENTLSPTEEHQTSSGWNLVWNYKNLISGYKIGLAMPEKLQPGPIT